MGATDQFKSLVPVSVPVVVIVSVGVVLCSTNVEWSTRVEADDAVQVSTANQGVDHFRLW
jgi:hypothetical protein